MAKFTGTKYVWSAVFEFNVGMTRQVKQVTVIWGDDSGTVEFVAKKFIEKREPLASNFSLIRLFRREVVNVEIE